MKTCCILERLMLLTYHVQVRSFIFLPKYFDLSLKRLLYF